MSTRTTRMRRKNCPGVKPNSVTVAMPSTNQTSRVGVDSALATASKLDGGCCPAATWALAMIRAGSGRTISAAIPVAMIQSTNSPTVRRDIETSDPAPDFGSPSSWPGYSSACGSPASGPDSQEPVIRAMHPA